MTGLPDAAATLLVARRARILLGMVDPETVIEQLGHSLARVAIARGKA